MLSALLKFVPNESKPSLEHLCISRKVFYILCRLLSYSARRFSVSRRVNLDVLLFVWSLTVDYGEQRDDRTTTSR